LALISYSRCTREVLTKMVYSNPTINVNAAPTNWWNWGASAGNAGTPAYNPTAPIFTPTNVGNIFNTPIGGAVYNPTPTNPTGGLMTNSGVLVGDNGKLNTILNSILASFAIFKGATHIPTQLPVESGGSQAIDPQMLAYLAAQQNLLGGGGNTGAQIENFIKNNTGVILIGGVILVAFMMKPPTRR